MKGILAQRCGAWLLACIVLLHADRVWADASWEAFVARYISAEGRVIDDGKGQISHSEGQGAAMLMAVAYGDRPRFERIWAWTARHLQVREDRLLAWRWEPGPGVTDRNNATDGDVLAAWALARAAKRWKDVAHSNSARELARAIREKLVIPSTFGPVLLPGVEGFQRPEGPILNLSYWVFPAFSALNDVDPDPVWEGLKESGLALHGASRFGRWQLPADWIQLRGSQVVPAPGFPSRFGYDAIRIPLYLRWAGLSRNRLSFYQAYWSYFDGARFVPGWTQFADNSVDSFDAGPGVRLIADWLRGKRVPLAAKPDMGHSYYAAFLQMLTRIAIQEAPRP